MAIYSDINETKNNMLHDQAHDYARQRTKDTKKFYKLYHEYIDSHGGFSKTKDAFEVTAEKYPLSKKSEEYVLSNLGKPLPYDELLLQEVYWNGLQGIKSTSANFSVLNDGEYFPDEENLKWMCKADCTDTSRYDTRYQMVFRIKDDLAYVRPRVTIDIIDAKNNGKDSLM